MNPTTRMTLLEQGQILIQNTDYYYAHSSFQLLQNGFKPEESSQNVLKKVFRFSPNVFLTGDFQKTKGWIVCCMGRAPPMHWIFHTSPSSQTPCPNLLLAICSGHLQQQSGYSTLWLYEQTCSSHAMEEQEPSQTHTFLKREPHHPTFICHDVS